jgi:ribosomal protein L29
MKKNEVADLRKKELKELEKLLADKKLDFMKIQMNVKAGKEKNLKKAKNTKREIALISTLMREKEFVAQMQDKKE